MRTEEDTIAESFLLIKEGVLSQDWNKICVAYKNISGEEIKIPEKKLSKLETIRQKMSEKTKKTSVLKKSKKPDKDIIEKVVNGIKFVSDPVYEEEQQFNKKVARPRTLVKRNTEANNLHTIENNPNGDFRVNMKPRKLSVANE